MSTSQIELRAGNSHLQLAPDLGGRITACSLESSASETRPLFQPFDEAAHNPDLWAKGGLYPLVPYCGRIRDARLWHSGRYWSLIPQRGSPHSLHGIAQRRRWTVLSHGRSEALVGYRHVPDEHWPWPFEVSLSVILSPRRLQLSLNLRNLGINPMPGGLGFHPYLLHQVKDVLNFEAGRPWPFDDAYLATRPPMYASGQVTSAAFVGSSHNRIAVEQRQRLREVQLSEPSSWPRP